MSDQVDTITDFAYHPLMERAQNALLNQLKRDESELSEQLKIKTEELKRKSQDHQFLGVQLYQLQQRIAKAQGLLEAAFNNSQTLIDSRLEDEEILKNEAESLSEFQTVLQNCKVQQKKYLNELGAQSETMKKMESYINEIEEEIQISKRVANKKEKSIRDNEIQKENQDKYLDSLMNEINKMGVEYENINDQIKIKEADIEEINSVLREVEDEISRIMTEKSQLMGKWKITLSGIGRRDEAITVATETLTEAQNRLRDDDAVIETLRRDILKEQKNNETLLSLRDRLEHELQWVDENLTKTITEVEQCHEKYTLLAKSLNKTDEEEKKIELLAKQLLLTYESISLSLQLVIRERQKLEEDLQIVQSTQANINKAVQTLGKEKLKTIQSAHQKENDVYAIENEIALAKINKLNLQVVVDQIRDKNNSQILDLKDKENTILKYQNDIRQRNDEVEKKVYRVDRLNKKFDRMIEMAGGAENLDSLENIVKRHQDLIEATSKEIVELERNWLKRQTEMVGVISEIEKLSNKNEELKSRISLLTQQTYRLETDQSSGKNEIKIAQQQNIDLRKDIVKLNSLISAGTNQESELQNTNYTLETVHYDELKFLDDECKTLSKSISEVRTSKGTVLEDVKETDRQILLWEKKLLLEKEMKQALDPLIGQDDVTNMEKEIHRMTLRLEAIKKHQQALSIEMETAVLKRDVITNRYGKTSGKTTTTSKNGSGLASINKAIGTASNELNSWEQKVQDKMNEVSDQKSKVIELNSYLTKLDSNSKELAETIYSCQLRNRETAYLKQVLLESSKCVSLYINQIKQFENDEKLNEATVNQKIIATSNMATGVSNVIHDLQIEYPHLNEILQRINDMSNVSFLSNL